MELAAFLSERMQIPQSTVTLSERIGEFTVRCLTATEDAEIRSRCTVWGETPAVDPNRYLVAVAAASVVSPDLDAAELQDSYRTVGREDTLLAMLLKPEFDALCAHLTVEGFADLVDTAKK